MIKPHRPRVKKPQGRKREHRIISCLMGAYFLGMAAAVMPVSAYAEDDIGEEEEDPFSELDVPVSDPLQPMNKIFFRLNYTLQQTLLKPISGTFESSPGVIRKVLSNFLFNLTEPFNVVNSLLQGNVDQGTVSAGRFAINSTIGLFGLIDVMGYLGNKPHREDFGQTLATWGVGEGPYLVLPLLGPSTLRDAVGRFLIPPYIDPTSVVLDNKGLANYDTARKILSGLSRYGKVSRVVDTVLETSIAPYEAARAGFIQNRKRAIKDRGLDSQPSAEPFARPPQEQKPKQE